MEISECSAIATFLAARKLSRIGIDSDRSSMSTVLDRVSVSVRSTSKSSGCRRTGRAPTLALDGVAHGALDVEVERVAELVGLGLVGALVADAGALDLVAADAVLGELGEQVGQRVLADAAHAPGRELEAALRLLDQAGLLEHLGQLGQALEAARRVVAEQVRAPRRGRPRPARRADVAERSRFSSWSMSPSWSMSCAASAKPSGSWPAELVAPVPAGLRERLAQVVGRAGRPASAGPCPRAAARPGPGAAPAARASSS